MESAVYYTTDNLLDFQTEGFWVRKDLSGAANVYTLTTAEKISVTGGEKLYTAMNGLSTDTLGDQFCIRVRQFDTNGDAIGSDTTFSTITSSNPVNYTLKASTVKILIALTTNNYNKKITPAQFMTMNPLIYAGFNSAITNATVYRKKGSSVDRAESDAQKALSMIGTPLVGFVPSSVGYPSIDTTAKTFTFYESADLIDRRFSNGKYTVPSRIAYDYSSVASQSSAIIFLWDIANATITAVKSANASTIDPSKYIPICMFRANKSLVYTSIPIRIDGKLFGVISEDRINHGSVWKNDNVRSINHRGYNSIAPENTLPAFKLSKDYMFDGVETDVRFTSDGVAVILHDESINRTARNADGTELSSTVNINSITYEQVSEYDFGIWKGSAYAGTKIPTFEKFMIACRRLGLEAYIELKVGTQAQIENLVDTAFKNGMKGHCSWISYNTTLLGYVHNYASKERLCIIADSWSDNLITAATALQGDNEVAIELTTTSSITTSVISSLVSADIQLEAFINGDYSIATAKSYITGFTTDSTDVDKAMYTQWNANL